MLLCSSAFRLRQTRLLPRLPLGSQVSQPCSSSSSPPYFWTSESDPTNHDRSHRGRLYKLPNSLVKYRPSLGSGKKFHLTLLPSDYAERCTDVFDESVLMVRNPALEVFDCVRALDRAKMGRPLKFVLWGKPGCGKTLVLSHVLHFFHTSPDFVVVNFGNLYKWLYKNFDVEKSSRDPKLFDHVVDSQMLLTHFKDFNAGKLEGLSTHQTYVWSPREKTEESSPLISLVDHGIERPKFASDCVACLMKELRLHCSEGKCKVAVVYDGVNALFNTLRLVRKNSVRSRYSPYKTHRHPDGLTSVDDLTVARTMKKMLRSAYGNSVVVATVDHTLDMDLKDTTVRPSEWWRPREINMAPETRPDTPFALLRQEGWEAMDPFIPVEVPPFDDGEMDVMIDYYVQKRYIREDAASEMGRREIRFVTGGNPADFWEYSAMW